MLGSIFQAEGKIRRKIKMHEACTTTENPEDMASVIIGYEINLAAYFKTPFDKKL